MRISLRTKLIAAIEAYRALRVVASDGYEAKLAAEPAAMQVILNDLRSREIELDAVWKEAQPEMNPVERARYVDMVGKDPAPESAPAAVSMLGRGVVASPSIQYPLPVQEAIDKVRQVFPGAKVIAFAKPGETLVLPPGESHAERMRKSSSAQYIPRVARPQEAPAAPAKSLETAQPPDEPGLFGKEN